MNKIHLIHDPANGYSHPHKVLEEPGPNPAKGLRKQEDARLADQDQATGLCPSKLDPNGACFVDMG